METILEYGLLYFILWIIYKMFKNVLIAINEEDQDNNNEKLN